MSNVSIARHPLVSHHLATLRGEHTSPAIFRDQIHKLSTLLFCEAAKSLSLSPITVQTPLSETTCPVLSQRTGLVPILRAGLGMTDPLLELIPEAEVWHLGFYRDETTLQPVEYYQKLTGTPPDVAFVLDPMLATGGSACAAIDRIKAWGVSDIKLLSIIAAPEGIEKVNADHPNIEIYVCAIDDHLNKNAYIVPGLGDAGDRIFNTVKINQP